MHKTIKPMLSALDEQQQQMLASLEKLCLINSGTTHLEGLEKTYQQLESFFKPIADECHRIQLQPIEHIDFKGKKYKQNLGDCLWIRKRPNATRRILLCGHMDTVYPQDSAFQQCTQISKHHLQGPGVTDMKGGLVVMLYALIAFEAYNNETDFGWDVFINSDEEIGSPGSSIFYDRLNTNYQAAFVYEPSATVEGHLVKNRKGSGKFTLVAHGKAAHAGRDFDKGRNAIVALAEKIMQIDALNHLRPGVTLNIGLIGGGEALNVVPESAVAKIDVRIEQPEDQQWVLEQLNQIVKIQKNPMDHFHLHGHFGRPVKRINPATELLFKKIQNLAKTLNLSLDWQDSGGCCDGNNLAQKNLPVIDTLGVRGGNIHSPKEYIVIESLVERAQLNALIFQQLSREK